MVGPLTHKIGILQEEKNQYLAEARKDIATRRAMHNSQLQAYDQEIKPLKRKAWVASMKQNFANISQRVGRMGPQ
jgi:hypothetical protein